MRVNRTKEQLVAAGGSEETEQAVAAALNRLARHQNPDGGWGCVKFRERCKDPSCAEHNKGEEGADYPVAAASFALLPFLASGQSHESRGPYQPTIRRGLSWMVAQQDQKTGRLGGTMYEHGLATITLCEAVGLSGDPKLKKPAQAAVDYIQAAQHDEGGWRYGPNQPGDTCVTGWQYQALKIAEAAGLQVQRKSVLTTKLFLKSVSKGKSGGLFSYTPESGPTPTMTAVGMLCRQQGGFKADAPEIVEGLNYLAANQPGPARNCYYWYYATQVMHNLPGPEWEAWNQNLRKLLLSTQLKDGCTSGSWSHEGHPHAAGPMMVTGLNTLNLEVYYRYAPLYAKDGEKIAPPKKD